MILLWGAASERLLQAVAREAEQQGHEARFVDPDKVGALDEGWLLEAARGRGELRMRERVIDLREVTGLYIRSGAGKAFWAWAEITPALVVNRPSSMGRCGSEVRSSSDAAICARGSLHRLSDAAICARGSLYRRCPVAFRRDNRGHRRAIGCRLENRALN